MTNPNSLALSDYMLAFYKAAYPGTANEPGSVGLGSGIKTQGATGGGSSNVAITGPVDGGGNVKVAIQGTPTVNSSQVAGAYQTKTNTGTVTAPGAGSGIASLTPGVAGYYKVTCVVGFGATAESTALDNFQLDIDGAVVTGTGKIPVANVVNTLGPAIEYYLTLTNTNVLAIANVAAGSAGSIYKATITATRIA